jgi:phosphoenolpyruvate carboxykinase (ATP)
MLKTMQTNENVFHQNLSSDELLRMAVTRHEGKIASNGALTVITGFRTGRSPKDRFIVKDVLTADQVDWGSINQPILPEQFASLWQRAQDHLKTQKCEYFASHLAVGADETYQIPVTIITDLAWHQLFCFNQFIRSHHEGDPNKKWTLLSLTNFKTDPIRDKVNSDGSVILDFTGRRVLLCGMQYAGEIKKAMFSVLNFILPPQNVLPMHCSANMGQQKDVALFFGLSGTGKTTLSADPSRYLIGDDEHGWSDNGVFNFEGGCYAKCINLSQENEPMIWQAIREGGILENVVLDAQTKNPCYGDASLTQNTRASYPLEYITMRVKENSGGHPQAIIFLTCDLYGVLPPVAKLTKEQAAYYFLSGYTALVGSTEMGHAAGIKPTFSTCFGAPFFPRPANIYADLLIKRIEDVACPVYLVNTGWTGGAHGHGGKRFDIPTTRKIIDVILNHKLTSVSYEILPGFNLSIPKNIEGVESKLLNPRQAWLNSDDYDRSANQLIEAFISNFKKYQASPQIIAAGPQLISDMR